MTVLNRTSSTTPDTPMHRQSPSAAAAGRRRRMTAAAVTTLLAAGGIVAAAPPARAGWLFLDGRVVKVVLACRDGIRFEAGLVLFEGQTPSRTAYRDVVKAAQPAPGPDAPWNDARNVIRAPLRIPALASPTHVPRDANPADTILLSHHGRYLMPVTAAKRPLALAPLGLTMGASSSRVTTSVGDCLLYAPIDIVPGRAHNQVRIGRGEVTVALKSTAHLRADRLDARTFRFGPGRAAPARSRVVDVDGDGRRDLVMRFTTRKTGLTCQSTSGTLVGQNRAGGRIEGRAKVAPVGCRR